MNITKKNSQPHYGNIAKVSGVNKHTIKSAGKHGIDVTDIIALQAFRDSKNQRNSETNRKRMEIICAKDPLNQKIRELRLRKYGYKSIGIQLGLSKGAVHKRCRTMGLNGRNGSMKRFNTDGIVMDEYQREAMLLRRADWRNHPYLAKEHDRLKYHRTKTTESMRLQADKAKAYHAKHKHCPKYKAKQRAKTRVWEARPKNRIRVNLSMRLWQILKDIGGRKHESVVKTFGCSRKELAEHIEAQFIGCMTWDNYGRAWHIDHIVPCSYFNLLIREEQRRCFHFSNLRPLWAMRNIREGNRRGAMTVPLGI